jgi:hypothetical protein
LIALRDDARRRQLGGVEGRMRVAYEGDREATIGGRSHRGLYSHLRLHAANDEMLYTGLPKFLLQIRRLERIALSLYGDVFGRVGRQLWDEGKASRVGGERISLAPVVLNKEHWDATSPGALEYPAHARDGSRAVVRLQVRNFEHSALDVND